MTESESGVLPLHYTSITNFFALCAEKNAFIISQCIIIITKRKNLSSIILKKDALFIVFMQILLYNDLNS